MTHGTPKSVRIGSETYFLTSTRNEALHLLLPRPLRNPPLQDPVEECRSEYHLALVHEDRPDDHHDDDDAVGLGVNACHESSSQNLGPREGLCTVMKKRVQLLKITSYISFDILVKASPRIGPINTWSWPLTLLSQLPCTTLRCSQVLLGIWRSLTSFSYSLKQSRDIQMYASLLTVLGTNLESRYAYSGSTTNLILRSAVLGPFTLWCKGQEFQARAKCG